MTPEQISNEILNNLTNYTDQDLKVLLGRLSLDMYGEEVSYKVAISVLAEHDSRIAER